MAGTEQSRFSQRCCGRSHRDIADTCVQARTPRPALPRALPDPQPFQHLFHITFLVFQALWAPSILSQMFPSSTSPPGMHNHHSTEERVQTVWFRGKLLSGMCARLCSQMHRPQAGIDCGPFRPAVLGLYDDLLRSAGRVGHLRCGSDPRGSVSPGPKAGKGTGSTGIRFVLSRDFIFSGTLSSLLASNTLLG